MLSSVKAEINEAYAERLEIVDAYNLTTLRDPNHKKDVFFCIEEDCIKVSLTVAPPADWEGDHLTAFALGHLPDLNVMEPLMDGLHEDFIRDMKVVKPINLYGAGGHFTI